MHTTHYARKIPLSGYPSLVNETGVLQRTPRHAVRSPLRKVFALVIVVYVLGLALLSARHVTVADKDELSLLQNMAATDENARLQLGLAYRDGRLGLKKDPVLADYWLQRAASGGNAYAQNLLNKSEQKPQSFGGEVVRLLPPQRSISHVESLAEAGDSRAQFELAMRYRDGSWGVGRDPGLSRAWLERSAAAGNEVARKEFNHLETTNR